MRSLRCIGGTKNFHAGVELRPNEMNESDTEERQGDGRVHLSMMVNGALRSSKVEPRMTLLDALREELGLTGPKKSCDRGECGACTVHIEGRRILSCMTLAVMHEGKQITTIEGLERDGRLHPLQEAFIEHDGFQCGFCTSGMILSGVALLRGNGKPTRPEIVHAMQGNVCRCGTYPRILLAVEMAARRLQEARK